MPNASRLVFTDALGRVTATFQVSPQPGDNYRAFAAYQGPWLNGIQIPQNDGTLARILDAAGNPLPTENARMVATPGILTVWRRLHVEVDSMGAVAGNTLHGSDHKRRRRADCGNIDGDNESDAKRLGKSLRKWYTDRQRGPRIRRQGKRHRCKFHRGRVQPGRQLGAGGRRFLARG